MFVEFAARVPGDLTPIDALTIRMAARILFDAGVALYDRYDYLAEPKGLAGYHATEAAQTLYDWIEEAERAGILAPEAAA
jgi:hypothetical protein